MGVYKDLTGKDFGCVFVVSRSEFRNISGSWLWNCKCIACGKLFLCSSSSLNGGVKSCGCIQRKIFVTNNTGKPSNNLKPYGQSNSKIIYRGMRDGAKKRGLIFDIDYDQFLSISSKPCFYCDAPPLQKRVVKNNRCNGEYVYNGLDRVDNNIGYLLSNVVPSCFKCNRAKFKMTKEEFFAWVKKVYSNICQ